MSLTPLERTPDASREREVTRERQKTSIAIVGPTDERWDKAVELEAATFIRSKYVKTPDELADEYAEYLPETSLIVATRDETSEVSGCVRAIEYDPDIGFKTIDDALDQNKPLAIDMTGWDILNGIDHADIYEVGTISAQPDAGAELYGAIIGYGLDREPKRRHVVASLDEKVLAKRIVPVFGEGVHILGPSVDYMGSPTVPVLIDLEKAWQNSQITDQYHGAFNRIAEGREMIQGGH